MLLALAEPGATAVLLSIFGLLMVVSVVFMRALDRAGVPVLLLFLVLGMIGGSEGIGGVEFTNYAFACRVGTIALVLILLDGGLNTSPASIRRSAAPAGVLATIGVAATAGLLALIGRLMGLDWHSALLVGAIVSSTDTAAVFAVLRGGNLHLKDRLKNTIEIESCVNDPMAVILTVTVIEAFQPGGPGVTWGVVALIPVQLVVGAGVGVGVGWLTRRLLNRVSLTAAGLYPVVTIAAGFVAFGLATLAQGSGFLAVYAAAIVLGSSSLPYKSGLARVHDAVAWMCQVTMFLMLGLLVFPSKLLPVADIGLGLGLALALVARPAVVMACLLPFGWRAKEALYVGWVGLRGAVPIILGTFPVLAGVPDAERVFHIVFFIVVVSALVPGASIVPLTRKWKLDESQPPTSPAALEVHSLRRLKGEVKAFRIDESLAVSGASLSQIHFPEEAAAIMVVRGDQLIAPRGNTVLMPGDFVYVLCREEDQAYIGLLFGREEGA